MILRDSDFKFPGVQGVLVVSPEISRVDVIPGVPRVSGVYGSIRDSTNLNIPGIPGVFGLAWTSEIPRATGTLRSMG